MLNERGEGGCYFHSRHCIRLKLNAISLNIRLCHPLTHALLASSNT